MPPRPRPKSDWTYVELLDAGAIDADTTFCCEFCGTKIRWIHVLEHERYPRPVQSGCCCAEKYCCDYDAKDAERQFRNRMARRRNFLDPAKWKPSNNNPVNRCRWVKLPDEKRKRLTVFEMSQGLWGIYLKGYSLWARFETREAAMLGAFEFVERLKERSTASLED